MKRIPSVILTSAMLCIAACAPVFGGGEGRPDCAVLSFEGAGAEEAGLAVLVCGKFAGLMSKNTSYEVMPRLTVNQKLSAQNYDRSSYASTMEAGKAAGKALKMDYVVIGNVGRAPEGYALDVSLVEVRTGKVMKEGTTPPRADMQAFANTAPQEAVELLFGHVDQNVQPPAAAAVSVKQVAAEKPASSELPAPKAKEAERAPAEAAANKAPKATTTQAAEPASSIAVPEPVIELGTEEGRNSGQPIMSGLASLSESWLSGHLQVGTRLTMFSLLHTRKSDNGNNFLGSIQELKAIQDYSPIKAYADVYLNRYLGVELTWDDARARTGAWNLPDVPYHSDGDFVVSGPILCLIGRYPNSTRFTPYAGAGIAFLRAKFLPTYWWHGGFESESDWEAAGSPDQIVMPLIRTIEPNNTHGEVCFAGCDYSITDKLLAGVYVRYMAASLTTRFYEQIQDYVEPMGTYSIPMDNVAYGLGISYAF